MSPRGGHPATHCPPRDSEAAATGLPGFTWLNPGAAVREKPQSHLPEEPPAEEGRAGPGLSDPMSSRPWTALGCLIPRAHGPGRCSFPGQVWTVRLLSPGLFQTVRRRREMLPGNGRRPGSGSGGRGEAGVVRAGAACPAPSAVSWPPHRGSSPAPGAGRRAGARCGTERPQRRPAAVSAASGSCPGNEG